MHIPQCFALSMALFQNAMSKSSREVQCYNTSQFFWISHVWFAAIKYGFAGLFFLLTLNREISALGFRGKLSYFLLSHFH